MITLALFLAVHWGCDLPLGPIHAPRPAVREAIVVNPNSRTRWRVTR